MAAHVKVETDEDIEFWCREFQVDPLSLFQAVHSVGTSARFVGEYLSIVQTMADSDVELCQAA